MSNKAKIAVIGAGLMGHGIAQVFASGGHPVRVYDAFPAALETLHAKIAKNLADIGHSSDALLLVSADANLARAVAGADFVFEAAPEKLELKRSLFAEMVQHAPRDALLASNTSVMPIHSIAHGLQTGERIMGTHWWNPPFLVPLVEVVGTAQTQPQHISTMIALLESVGKTAVHVLKDVPGFVGNRLQHALWREAIALVADGVCDARTVDLVVKASFGRRLAVLGPLENADLVGTDLTLDIHRVVMEHLDRTPGPSPYLEHLVASGRLGMKTGAGFTEWSADEAAELRNKVIAHLLAAMAPKTPGKGTDERLQ